MKVIVLGGGDSPEREVSLRSAKAVEMAAKKAGFDTLFVDPLKGLDNLGKYKDAIVLPILHGKNGEDGWIQSKLENLELPYLGTRSAESSDCFDKWRTREILAEANIQIPDGEKVTAENYRKSALCKQPHVLKVVHGGSSIGTLIVRTPPANEVDIENIFGLEGEAVIEQLIEGVEITVPILGSKALPVIEIRPPTNKEFDYENKYNGATAEICPPQSVSEDLQKQAQALAENVHKAMGAKDLSRVDMMIDEDGNLYVLEINTMPGLTDQSLFPKSAAVAGYDMPSLIKEFVKLARD